MACRRGVAGLLDWSLILTAALALLVPSASAQDCKAIFDTAQGQLNGYDDKVEVSFTVAETTAQGTELYELSWIDDCVDSPQINDVDFTNYFTINDTEDCMWTISVKVPLTGVPDYPDPKDEISIIVDFDGFTNITYSTCHVTLIHTITEENTQTPEPESPNYTLDIKEDFNVGYAIPDFNISVHDKDGQSPNNQFSVSVDPDCPLEATQAVYTSGGFAQQVEFKLLEALDFETDQTMTCTVTFEDKGSPPLTDTASITIMVQDVNDEPPRFDYTYYYSELLPDVKPNDALVIQPSPISATDGDTSIGDPITYTMSNANPDVNGLEYFIMKENSGEVTLLKELDNDFLLNERVFFFVQASDDTLTALSMLHVILPPVPTTTDTTCEPCTCPTYMTDLVTDRPTAIGVGGRGAGGAIAPPDTGGS